MTDTTKNWVRLCSLSALPGDKAVEMIVANQNLVIARDGENAYVLQGFCSHMLFQLAGSKIQDCKLTCALHHSIFDIRDGSVIDWATFPPLVGPALAQVRARKTLRTYETKVQNGDVYLLWSTAEPDKVKVRVKV